MRQKRGNVPSAGMLTCDALRTQEGVLPKQNVAGSASINPPSRHDTKGTTLSVEDTQRSSSLVSSPTTTSASETVRTRSGSLSLCPHPTVAPISACPGTPSPPLRARIAPCLVPGLSASPRGAPTRVLTPCRVRCSIAHGWCSPLSGLLPAFDSERGYLAMSNKTDKCSSPGVNGVVKEQTP